MARTASIRAHDHGDARLLHHLESLGRALGRRSRYAHARLEAELGPDLARILAARLITPRGRLAA